MHSICYVSTAAHLMSDADLETILRQARTRNAVEDITGLLLYHDGTILQILEGPEDAVDRCFGRIGADDRHKGILRIWTKSVDQRSFSNWAMGFVPSRALSNKRRDGFVDLRDIIRRNGVTDEPSDIYVVSMVQNFLSSFRDLPPASPSGLSA